MSTHVVGVLPRLGRVLLCVASGLTFATATAQAQRAVTGRVTDVESKAPVPGAAVTVLGTTLGAVTTDSGTFHITGVPTGAATLQVRRIGYKPASLPLAADQNDVSITLTQDVLQLEAQVVTGTATTISSRNATNDVTVLNADQINQVPTPTIENSIQGKIPGAQISQNNGGAPGGGLQIQVRGITSINADANPLWVIDGVVVNNETINSGANAISGAGNNTIAQDEQDNSPNRIADINPNDIESIEVLKGASAAAIYGSRAGSGVIVVTTKKGTSGAPKWDLTGRVGTFNQAHGLDLRTFPTLASAEAWSAASGAPLDTAAFHGNQDFQNQLFGNNLFNGGQASWEADLSVRGQSGSTQYFLSAMSKYDNGIMYNTGYDKQAARANVTQIFSGALSFTGNLYFQNSLTRRGITGNDNVGISPYDVFSVTPQAFNMNQHSSIGSTIDGLPTYNGWIANPYGRANAMADAFQIQTPDNVQRFIGGGNVTWKPWHTEHQDVTVTAIGGADLSNEGVRLYSPPELQVEQFKSLPGTVTSLSGNISYTNWSLNGVHHYAGGTNLDLTTSIGWSGDERTLSNPYQVGQLLPPGVTTPTAGSVQNLFDTRTASRTMSLYAQEQVLTLDQRLTVTGGITAERSTDNGNISHFYAFPKVAASYRIPQFVGFLDELKVRAAYGVSGTDPIYGVRYPDLQNQILVHQSLQPGVYTNETLNNTGIRPETNTEIETGFDATLFKSRANFTATVYRKRITDLLLLGQIAPSSGANAQWFNGGQFTNYGLEMSLALTPVQIQNGLTWVFTTTYARNYSHVDALPVPAFTPGSFFGGFFGTPWVQVGNSVSAIVNTNFTNGAGLPLVIGNAQPNFIMAFGNEFNFHRFHLYGLIDWARGGNTGDLTSGYFDFAFFNGTNGNNNLLADTAASNKRLNSVLAGGAPYVEPATYVKLRQVTLSYDLPMEWFRSMSMGRISSARLQLSGYNLWMSFPNYFGLDPEVSNFGNQQITRAQEVTPYPTARSFFLSLDLGF